jgi:4'-phosphopantetheinyl transferase EntD
MNFNDRRLPNIVGAILPAGVYYSETMIDTDALDAFPEEQAIVQNSVSRRRKEFFTVRRCAREALSEMGIRPAPILSGAHGEPLWPDGVVGSMTHCPNYRAAVVASRDRFSTVGIDAEPNLALPDRLVSMICMGNEIDQLKEWPLSGVALDRLMFSAKEATYKAWYPLTHRWLGFEDVTVTIYVDGSFDARLLVDGPHVDKHRLGLFSGQWVASHDLLVTSIVVPKVTS